MAAGKVLGIIGCVVLADELTYVLSRDQGLSRVFVIDNDAGRILRDKMARSQMEAVMVSPNDLDRVRSRDRYSVLIWMNPAGPHDDQAELRGVVRAAAEGMSKWVDLCLCFYGLCRNSLWRIGQMGDEVGVPMMILTDIRGRDVDDCFGANIGGKQEYLDAIVNNRGTIFVSPGYAENWQRRQNEKSLEKIIEQVENMRFVFERMGYSKVMRLENGLGDRDKFVSRVDAFSKIFDLQVVSRPCGPEVFEHTYSLAKGRLNGKRP